MRTKVDAVALDGRTLGEQSLCSRICKLTYTRDNVTSVLDRSRSRSRSSSCSQHDALRNEPNELGDFLNSRQRKKLRKRQKKEERKQQAALQEAAKRQAAERQAAERQAAQQEAAQQRQYPTMQQQNCRETGRQGADQRRSARTWQRARPCSPHAPQGPPSTPDYRRNYQAPVEVAQQWDRRRKDTMRNSSEENYKDNVKGQKTEKGAQNTKLWLAGIAVGLFAYWYVN